MADSPIGSLPQASVLNDSDLFVLEQAGSAKKLTGLLLTNYIDRNLVTVSVVPLNPGQTPSANYNRVTGALVLSIPRGNGVANMYNNQNNETVVVLEDGTEFTFNLVKGDTGKSAYQYAVDGGYTGTESEYAQMMLELYQAGLNEVVRESNEQDRIDTFQDMMDQVQDKMDELDGIVTNVDARVADTTLIITRVSTLVADTTLVM